MFAHYQHNGHEPKVETYHHPRHLVGPCNELFYSFCAS